MYISHLQFYFLVIFLIMLYTVHEALNDRNAYLKLIRYF
jgi:hypothetical protein